MAFGLQIIIIPNIDVIIPYTISNSLLRILFVFLKYLIIANTPNATRIAPIT